MLKQSTVLSRIAAAALAVAAAVCASVAVAQAPAADALKQIIDEGNPAYLNSSTPLSDRERIATLYEANGYRLLWSDGAQPTQAASNFLQELRQAGDRGLDPQDYPGERLASLLTDLLATPHSAMEQWALFDESMSLAALRFVSDLHYGRIDPATVGYNLTVERMTLDLPSTLAHLASTGNVAAALDALEPQFTHYVLLKRQLMHYRALAADSGLNTLPALPAKSVKPADAYAGAAQLERLLSALGD